MILFCEPHGIEFAPRLIGGPASDVVTTPIELDLDSEIVRAALRLVTEDALGELIARRPGGAES